HMFVAPDIVDETHEVLARRKNMIVLVAQPARNGLFDLDVRSVPGGLLVQEWDRARFDRATAKTVTRRAPTEAEWEQLGLAWTAVKHVKSNAIVLFKEGSAVGVGAGQMSRVEAVELAVQRAGDRSRGSVMASHAFFPFHDELLFIVAHQVYELWFKVVLFELEAARGRIDADDIFFARHHLHRVHVIEGLLVEQIEVLETMSPQDFLAFRSKLAPASGFQS